MSQQLLTAGLLVIIALAVIGSGFIAAWLLCRWASDRREKRHERAKDTITLRIAAMQRERHLTTMTGLIPVIRDGSQIPGRKGASPERGLSAGLHLARQDTAA